MANQYYIAPLGGYQFGEGLYDLADTQKQRERTKLQQEVRRQMEDERRRKGGDRELYTSASITQPDLYPQQQEQQQEQQSSPNANILEQILGGGSFVGVGESATSGLGGGLGSAAGGAAGGAMSGMFGGSSGAAGLTSSAGTGFASGFTGSAGGAAGSSAGASGGAGMGAAGWWALLAAAIAANESAAEEDKARNPNKTQWYGDVLTGRVFEQDMSKRWLPKIAGESEGGSRYANDEYGFATDAHILADISTGDFSNAWEALTEDSTVARFLKKVF